MSNCNTYFNRFNTPIVFEHLFDIFSVCFLQFRLVSKVNPRKFNSSTLSNIYIIYFKCKSLYTFIRHMENTYLVLLLFNNNLLIFSNSLILQHLGFYLACYKY